LCQSDPLLAGSASTYKNVNKALSGDVSPEQALKKAQTDMDKALKTF
jgi:ABC-type glycerol-3-phosphate transport system substrate-binding protein